MKVSVMIPVFNEEESLPELYQELRVLFDSEPWEGEAIMVDDGSSDRSASVIARLAELDERVRLVRFARNFFDGAEIRQLERTEVMTIPIPDARR